MAILQRYFLGRSSLWPPCYALLTPCYCPALRSRQAQSSVSLKRTLARFKVKALPHQRMIHCLLMVRHPRFGTNASHLAIRKP